MPEKFRFGPVLYTAGRGMEHFISSKYVKYVSVGRFHPYSWVPWELLPRLSTFCSPLYLSKDRKKYSSSQDIAYCIFIITVIFKIKNGPDPPKKSPDPSKNCQCWDLCT